MAIDARRSGIDIAYDALLGITGPVGAPGNPIEAGNVTVDAAGTKGYVYVGKYRTGYVECRLAGAFDRTTGDEVIQFDIYEATSAAGAGAAIIASSPVQAASHRGNLSDQAASTATGGGNAAGTLPFGPTRVGFSTGAGGFVGVTFNTSGNTPIIAGVSADIVMTADGIQQSGR